MQQNNQRVLHTSMFAFQPIIPHTSATRLLIDLVSVAYATCVTQRVVRATALRDTRHA